MRIKYFFIGAMIVLGVIGLTAAPGSLAGKKDGSINIQAIYDGNRAFDQMKALADFGPRVGGGPTEALAAAYIEEQLLNLGLDVEVQEFPARYFEELSPPIMQRTAPTPTIYPPNDPAGFYTMTYSGAGDVTAPVTPVDISPTSGCEAADFAGFPAGHIALLQRGTCTFHDKATNALNAGAVGVIIFNQPGSTGAIQGTLGDPVDIPVVGTSYAIGQELQTPGTIVRLKIDSVSDVTSTSQNVIGTLAGTDPTQGIVYLGASYDSFSLSPGANYFASGVGAMLEAARVLTTKAPRTKATLKFIAFGANGFGSDHYVGANSAEVSAKGIGMINPAGIGVGNTLVLANFRADLPELLDYTKNKATSMGLAWNLSPNTVAFNNIPFERAGVPAVYLEQHEDPNRSTPADTPDKINLTTLEKNGELAAAVMNDWAKNPVKRSRKAVTTKSPRAYLNPALVEK